MSLRARVLERGSPPVLKNGVVGAGGSQELRGDRDSSHPALTWTWACAHSQVGLFLGHRFGALSSPPSSAPSPAVCPTGKVGAALRSPSFFTVRCWRLSFSSDRMRTWRAGGAWAAGGDRASGALTSSGPWLPTPVPAAPPGCLSQQDLLS